jgi:hypothetical protein
MIDKCFNPACDRKLRYLRDGRVIRVIRREADQSFVQHYWLCGTCYDAFDFVFLPGGDVDIEPRAHAHSHKVHIGDVLIVSNGGPPIASPPIPSVKTTVSQ